MRLEERIVLDGAVISTVEHGLNPTGDTTPITECAVKPHSVAPGDAQAPPRESIRMATGSK